MVLTALIIVANMGIGQVCYDHSVVMTKNENILMIEGRGIKIEVGESEYQKELARIEKERKEVLARERKRKISYSEFPNNSTNSNYEVVGEDSLLNCVQFAKETTGINHPMGNGARYALQGTEARVGAIGSLKGIPHAVVIESVNGDQITFVESNYVKYKITRRSLPSSEFIGFIYR